ncbi:MAG: zinc ribbon domain-containing protein [Nitrospiraceae bacterium]
MEHAARSTYPCPSCGTALAPAAQGCPECGVEVAPSRRATSTVRPKPVRERPTADPSLVRQLWEAVYEAAITVDAPGHAVVLLGRALLWLGLVIWGWKLATASIASNYVGESFLHLINLPFHEAGHIFFSPLGRFLQVLGGSLGQLLMPAICAGALLLQHRNPFGASVATWWLGESLLDLAPYINDARALELMLLGGVTGKEVEDYHDWEYLLRTTGLLPYDHVFAGVAHALGTLTMVFALIWGATLLMKQQRRLSQAHGSRG